ncbi:hypothetical protein INS49_000631 [Diaporthe citri]|uniref:uncharacterized protein n=1 Tax=Diaporthe citri TaxID=83186 RepID=UPI001C7EAEDD|nr:uncharacterized protein INS49_000631 [Diaporthe citri]KAG6366454.1 hypothetical protein INS49_000631 [Diaporthe citri]
MSPRPPQRDVMCRVVSRSSLSLKLIEITRLIIPLVFAVALRLSTNRLQWLPLPPPLPLYFGMLTARTSCSKHPKLRSNRSRTSSARDGPTDATMGCPRSLRPLQAETGDPAMVEPAMNDDLSLLDFAAPREDFQNLAMNMGGMDQGFDDIWRGQYPGMDGGWAEYDRAGLKPGPIYFGFDDLVFK